MTDRPEYNVTGVDYADRAHFRYDGPLIDIHAHVMRTRPSDPAEGPPQGPGPDSSTDQAETLLAVGREFGVERTFTMCHVDDVAVLRVRFGKLLEFNGPISKPKRDDPDDVAYRLLDRFLELGVRVLKFWSAPRGRERGLFVDAPWRIECARRARAAGVRVVMVHVADPDLWFAKQYADTAKYGTKANQYPALQRMLEEFPDMTWIAAHMGGDPEHPDHLETLLERYPHLHFDTSATKWQVREVSRHPAAIRDLICRHPTRFLWGTDQVSRHGLVAEHYVSRYWCQRTLWESAWKGRSPIRDPDFVTEPGGPPTPELAGVELPCEVLRQVYYDNARRLFPDLD